MVSRGVNRCQKWLFFTEKNTYQLYAKDTLATPPRTLYAYYRDMLLSDHTALLPSVNVPVLLIVGKNDTVFPPRIAKDMHEQLPNSTIKIVNGDHSVILKKGKKCYNIIEKFLEKNF